MVATVALEHLWIMYFLYFRLCVLNHIVTPKIIMAFA